MGNMGRRDSTSGMVILAGHAQDVRVILHVFNDFSRSMYVQMGLAHMCNLVADIGLS